MTTVTNDEIAMSRMADIRRRTKWFLDARFGMFIHWGLYAIPARGEWVRQAEKMPESKYMEFFREFNPDRFDPRAWARAASAAGMKYAVMTAKHHDGFCLFDSQLTDYKSTRAPVGRDLVREYVDAFRAEGLKVGLYYSLIDWHHEDYPHFGHTHHPMREDTAFKDKAHNFDNYLAFMHGQVRELCTNYGKIDILWFDFSYDEMVGEKWKATELIKMVRSLQPDVITDNRLEASGDSRSSSLLTGKPSAYSGDFVSPEQIIPPDGVTDAGGQPLPWEACITMNNHWGYCATDHAWKSPKSIVRKLVECVSKGGNLLLNVGPTGRGEIPAASLRVLGEVSEWMCRNGASIHGCGNACLPKPEWGYYTRNGKQLYAHVFDGNFGPTALAVPVEKVARIRLLADGSELVPVTSWATSSWPQYLFVTFGPDAISTVALPDDTDTVVELEMKD
ncbi:MAG: alpha-L-fucosidase [bacterium]